MATLEQEVANLTTATNNLITAVSTKKVTLDNIVTGAEVSMDEKLFIADGHADRAETAEASALVHAGIAQTESAKLANYTSMTSLERALPTKAEFNAMAEERKANRAGSGFEEWGHSYTSGNVNEGIYTTNSSPNFFYMGRDGGTVITSKTSQPYTIINGVKHKLDKIKYNGIYNQIDLPTAPTVTHADTSNSGMVLNGRNMVDTSGWTAGATNTLSVVNGVLKATITTGWERSYQAITGLVIGQKYTIEIEAYTDGLTAGNYNVVDIARSSIATPADAGEDKRFFVTTTNKRQTIEITATQTSYWINMSSNYAGNSIFLKNVFVCPSSELSRSDLVFLETWHENIAEKDFVYPLGNIQYLGADTDGLTGIVAGAFAGKETYSNFGNWQASNALVGKGYVWSTMTEANKIKFVSNPENNCYIDGTTIMQVRYRVRVVQGLGDSWKNIKPELSVGDGYTSPMGYTGNYTAMVTRKGKNTSIASDFTTTATVSNAFYSLASSYPTADEKSRMTQGMYATKEAYGLTYAIPIALVHRRNQGAYHPKFNPNGTRKIINAIKNDYTQWYNPITNIWRGSIADCFFITTIAGNGIAGEGSGYIASASNGRPDGLFYDQIAERDIIDLRNSSHKVQDYKRLLEREFNKAVAGTTRGSEGEWEYIDSCPAPTTNSSSSVYYVSDAAKFKVGDKIKVTSISKAFNKYVTISGISTTEKYISTVETFTYNRVAGEVLYYSKQSTHKKSNTLLHCDIIGNPANYYRGQTYTDLGVSKVIELNIGDVIWNRDGNDLLGLDGHFYKSKIYVASHDLINSDYTNATYWEDLGADWDGAGSWRTGVSGTPLVVGENGEDYITTGINYPTMKLSKKATTFKFALVSSDNGVTWTFVGNPTFTSTSNTIIVDDPTISGRLTLAFYETHTNMAENAVNSEVIELGDVRKFQTNHVAYIAQSLLNKVTHLAWSMSYNLIKPLNNRAYNESSGKFEPKLSIGTNIFLHDVITADGVQSVQVKTLPYITKQNNKAYLNLVFKEMKHNGTSWGDDSKFNIVDNVSTTTDLNAQTVLIGQKRIELPYFIEDKE